MQVKMILRDDLYAGCIVYLDPESGKVGQFIPHTRKERFIRWCGRLFRQRFANYNQRGAMGILVQDGNAGDVVSVMILSGEATE